MTLGLPTIDYVVIGFYLAIMLGIGFYFSKAMKGGKDFFVGGNLIPGWVAGVSLYMTCFSAWTFTGAASFTYNTTWYGIIYFATWPISFVLGFKLSAIRWRRSRVSSPIEYVHTRFNRSTHLFLSVIYALSLSYWPAHHLASLSKICAPTLFPGSEIALSIFVVVTGIIILIYTFSGGFWAVCITDVVQSLVLLTICVVLIPTAFLSGDLGTIGEFFHKIPPLKFHHVIRGSAMYDEWYLIGLLVSNVFGYSVGEKAQRFYSVKNEKEATKVGNVATLLIMTGPILFGIPPLIARVLWPDISLMEFFQDIAKPDENVYIAVVLKYMPAGMVGIFLSAMMAASMSAMDSAWNTVSAIVSVDIFKTILHPKASDAQVLKVGRITTVFLCALAIGMALVILNSSVGIFTFSTVFFALVGVPVSIPLLIGVVKRDISRWSAISSILIGTIMSSVFRFGLNYPIGQQYFAVTVITVLVIFISNPLGRLYLKNRQQALLAAVGIGLVTWLFCLGVNFIPDLSVTSLFSGYSIRQLAVLITAVAIGGLHFYFAKLYAADLQRDQSEVDIFFKKLDTPIDVEKEVLAGGAREQNILPLVGTISMLMAGLSLMILLSPVARTHVIINLTVAGLLFFIGLGMFLSKKKEAVK